MVEGFLNNYVRGFRNLQLTNQIHYVVKRSLANLLLYSAIVTLTGTYP